MTHPTLTSRERARLRAEAHHLDPLQHIGTQGVTPAVVSSALDALNTRELIKVRVLESAPDDVRESGHRMAAAIPGAQIVQTIGRVFVLYRPLPDDDA